MPSTNLLFLIKQNFKKIGLFLGGTVQKHLTFWGKTYDSVQEKLLIMVRIISGQSL
jgi:hypothetical protein